MRMTYILLLPLLTLLSCSSTQLPPPVNPLPQIIDCSQAATPEIKAQMPELIRRVIADVTAQNWVDLVMAGAKALGPVYHCVEQALVDGLATWAAELARLHPDKTLVFGPLRVDISSVIARLQAHLAWARVKPVAVQTGAATQPVEVDSGPPGL